MTTTKDTTTICYPLDVECPQLANAYVPIQPWGDVYQPIEGLRAGTIFPGLADHSRYRCKEHGGIN